MKKIYALKLFLMTLFVALAGTVSAETVTFVAGTDVGTGTGQTTSGELSKSGITLSCDKVAFSTAQYRFYAGSTVTISSDVGNITKVEFTCASSYAATRFSVPNGGEGTYTAASNTSGTWEGDASSFTLYASQQVRATQIVVTYTPSGSQKTYPNLSFTPASVTMTIGEIFTAPTLNNEYGVTVAYSSNNTSVAEVDATTGAVTIKGAGSATITAASEEDATYQEGSASYTIQVNKVDPALAFSEGSVQVTLGDAFTAPTLTNNQNVTVAYSSSDTDVAEVDPTTGAVTIKAAGYTTITAASTETDSLKESSASYNLTVIDPSVHVYWSEDWTGAAENAVPSDVNSDYTYDNGTGTTKIYNAVLAGGSSPELLVAKGGGFLTYDAIDVDGHQGTLTLTYKANYDRITVTSATDDVVLTKGTADGTLYRWTITVPTSVSTLSLTLTNSTSSNVRLDDILLTGDYSATTLLDADLAFNPLTATTTVGATFTAPTLSNPHQLAVTYSSSNEAIATVDSLTGAVTTLGIGVVTITASSAKTDTYKAGSASYTLTIESATATTTATYWSEDWTDAVTDDTPDVVNSAYTYTDGGSATKIYEQILAGGDSPELLVSKSGGSLTYNAISVAGHTGTLTLTYGANNDNLVLTSDTEGVTVSKKSYENKVATWTISVPTTTSTLSLTLANSKSNNTRLDNILLTGTVYDLGTGSFTITAAGYGTYYTDQAFIMPTGVQGGVITAVATPNSNGIAKATTNWKYKAGSVVPANEALLIKGAANTYDYTITESNASATADNLLKGSTVAVTPTSAVPSYYYMLSYGKNENANVLGFYYGNSDGSAFLSGANKCWIELPQSGSSVRGLIFDFNDDVTGINSIDAAEGVKAVYDLQGRRVVAPKAGNIYIVNGKKVLVK